jgi:hypothetical protein
VIRSEKSFWLFAAFFFAILVLLSYWPVVFGYVPLPGVLVTQFPAFEEFQPRHERPPVADIGDLIDTFYPYHAFSSKQIRGRVFPLWNPYFLGGFPFQAETQTALFYPLHGLYYLFPTPTAWTLNLLLRTWLAAMFMTLLIRYIGGSKAGSIIAGTAFAFSGFVVAWQGAAMGDSIIWLPLACYCVARLHRQPSITVLAISGLAFSMPVLAGHPETAMHVVATACFAALLLWVFPTHGSRFNRAFLLRFSAAGLLAVGLAAIQLLPTLEWVTLGDRDLHAIWPSFPLHQGMGFLSRDILRGPNSAGVFVPNAAAYVGMFTILAATVGLLYPSRHYVIWFTGLIAFGLAGTFGIDPVHWVLTHLPVVKGLKNERMIFLADFGLPALAGLGVTLLEREKHQLSRMRGKLCWILTGLVFLFAVICVYKLRLATEYPVEWLRRPSASMAMLFVGLAVLLWKFIRKDEARSFPVIATALVAIDVSTYAYGYTSFTPRDEIFPPAPVFDFVRRQGPAHSFRMIPASAGIFASNSGLTYEVETLTGYEVQIPQALKRFTADFARDLQPYIDIIGEKVLNLNDRRIDMFNVKYLVAMVTSPEYATLVSKTERFSEVFKRGNIAVFENKTALPRAFLVTTSGIRVIPNHDEQLAALKDSQFDPERTVILGDMPEEFSQSEQTAAGSDVNARVELTDSDINSYRFRVHAPAPSVLVVSQNPYPGWKASVDGRPLSVFRANHVLTGVAIPEGDYSIEFVFDPASFKIGAVVSFVSVCVLAVMLIFGARAVRE